MKNNLKCVVYITNIIIILLFIKTSTYQNMKQPISTFATTTTIKNINPHRLPNPPNHFQFGSHGIPHPEKAYKGGEDAYYAANSLLVVADGVGGWARRGIDPGLYSKELV